MTGQRPLWRALGAFWALVAAGTLGTVLVLDYLGPPEPPAIPAAVAPVPRETPQEAQQAPPQPPSQAAAPSAPAPPAASAPASAETASSPTPQPAAEAPDPGLTTAPLAPLPGPEAPLAPPEAPPPPPLPAASGAQDNVTPIAPPDPALLETSPFGPLPRIAPDGREARQVYARPFQASEGLPRIALVVGGMGSSTARSEEAIRRLPPAVTLAFNPQVSRSDLLLEQARRRGMEVVLALPLESAGAEADETLLRAGADWTQNRDRLLRALGRFAGYAGTVGGLGGERGERFAAETDQLEAMQAELRRRGLYYLDPRPHAATPTATPTAVWGAAADLVLDEPLTRGELEHRLAALERLAREQGSAIGLAGEPAPMLVDRIAAWAEELAGRGLVLAPLSALVHPPQDGAAAAAR